MEFLIQPQDAKKTGVYWIRNTVNGKFYIGSTQTVGGFHRRFRQHKKALENNRHHNVYLQRAYNNNPTSFVFEIIEVSKPSQAPSLEQWYIDNTRCLDSEFGYNMCSVVGSILPSNEGRLRTAKANSKEVCQLSWDYDIIRYYKSTAHAARETGFSRNGIGKAARGEYSGHHGFRWVYKHEYFPTKEYNVSIGDGWNTYKSKVSNLAYRHKVAQYSNGVLIETFDSIADAKRRLGISRTSDIGSVCSGKRKMAHGYTWKFI